MNNMLKIIYDSKLQQNNREYMGENEETFEALNRRALQLLNYVSLAIIVIYYIIQKMFFEYPGLDYIYITAFIVQLILMVVLYYWCRKPHALKVTNLVCVLFQICAMSFITLRSVFWGGQSLPAVYFAPAVIGFSVFFLFSWNLIFGMVVGEVAVMLALSYLLKPVDIFMIDVCSSIFVIVIVNFLTYVLSARRVADNKVRKEMKLLNAIDKLTQLNNKSSAEMLCREYIEGTDSPKCALLVIDFDNFKMINDSFGHRQGDKVLAAFGEILKDVIRKDDIAGRIGGDEFIVLLKNCDDMAAIRSKADLIIENTHRIMASEVSYKFTCSVGIAVLKKGDDVTTYGKMFSKADRALYIAKKRGRDCSYYYNDGSGEADNERKKLIVVDDQEVSRAILRSCFEENYDVVEAENGKEALDLVAIHYETTAAILLDIEMPVMKGFVVLKELQSNRRYKKIPVLIVTGYEKNELQALEMGAVDIITKPFDPQVVKKRVQNAIRVSNM